MDDVPLPNDDKIGWQWHTGQHHRGMLTCRFLSYTCNMLQYIKNFRYPDFPVFIYVRIGKYLFILPC